MAGMLPYKFLRLPHKQQLGGGMCENCTIRLRGRTFESPKGFTIRLACGEDDSDDSPLLFTSDMQKNRIVFTTKDSSAWLSCGETPFQTEYFKPATEFDFTLECSADGYLVTLDDVEHRYQHKLPFHVIRYIVVDGDINLQEAKISVVPDKEERNRIPVSRTLPEKTHGTRIIVCGVPVRAKPHRMAIDFNGEAPGNLEFHFNPRFGDQVLVRNTLLHDKWGEEERQLSIPFPFVYGLAFKLLFILEEDYFHVRLNGNCLCKYRRRDEPRGRIVGMNIFGSVVITKAEVL